jgi:hypothetical protein
MSKEAGEGGAPTPRRTRGKNYGVNEEKFIRTWQDSPSAQEAADRLGMPRAIASARASKYRHSGKDLKVMPSGMGRGGGRKSTAGPLTEEEVRTWVEEVFKAVRD